MTVQQLIDVLQGIGDKSTAVVIANAGWPCDLENVAAGSCYSSRDDCLDAEVVFSEDPSDLDVEVESCEGDEKVMYQPVIALWPSSEVTSVELTKVWEVSDV